ncbi:MAG TPA: sensor domain-containing diguanylate cyclase [Kofleriaceae bacterium]|nr:sensor domain-containing diguanylate cyclase [Kofleriaceae bacterium]
MTAPPSTERLLSVIELQNAVAAAAMTTDQTMSIVGDRARTLTGAAGALVAVVEGPDIVVRAVSGRSGSTIDGRLQRTSTYGRAVAEGKPVSEGTEIAVPLLYGENAVGVLGAIGTLPTEEVLETLRLLAQVIAIALHRAYTYPKPRLDNQHDPLTGLGNRRSFDERLEAELARNKRYGHSFSLAFLDLDGLESAYDRLGQGPADDALRTISSILSKYSRVIDACFRVGPDDFAIVMPGTSLEGGKTLVERCRAHIDEARLCDGMVTAAFGVVEAADETAESLQARANAAHTADKHSRRGL